MVWRRRRDTVSEGAAITPAGTSARTDGGRDGDPSVPSESLPDDALLIELSRAFADDHESDADTSPAYPAAAAPSAPSASSASRASSARATISIVGDDLPDAAYLDDELERDSGSQPVFIDDDGSSDAIMPQEASTRGIEPRLRQRRIGVKRSANRRRLWWLALAGFLVVIAIAVLALLGSSLFAVEQVTVTGNVYTDRAALDAVVDDLTGTAVLLVDTAAVEADVEAIPWVRDARVSTSFPDSASIEIRERTPVAAMMGADGRVRVIDVDGRVLSLVDGQPVALVWISGPDTLDVAPGQFASIGYSAAASLVTKLTPDIRSRVDSMLVTPDGADLVLVLTSGAGPVDGGLVEVRFGSALGENSQIEKLVRLQRTLEDVGDKPVAVIDVSTSEVTVR